MAVQSIGGPQILDHRQVVFFASAGMSGKPVSGVPTPLRGGGVAGYFIRGDKAIARGSRIYDHS